MKARVEFLDGSVKVVSMEEWETMKAKGDDWLSENVMSAEAVDE